MADTKLTSAEIKTMARETVIERFGVADAEDAVLIGSGEYAVPVEIEGVGTRYVGIKFTTKLDKDTKVNKAFDPEVASAVYQQTLAEAAEKKAAAAEAKAKKIAKSKVKKDEDED